MSLSKPALDAIGQRFRRAIELWLAENPETVLSTNFAAASVAAFPIDCCKATSYMLGHYLSRTIGVEHLPYVWGTRDGDTHGWLCCDGYFIDLTGDQFPDQPHPVVVACQEESQWHWTFLPHKMYEFSLRSDSPLVGYATEVAKHLEPESKDP